MKEIFLSLMLLGLGPLSSLAHAQSDPAAFPLAGDWDGVSVVKGTVYHLTLHMNTTPEGKMTALVDFTDKKISGIPAIGGSFDGNRLVLRFLRWKPNSDGDFKAKIATYEAMVNESASEMTGTWTDDDAQPLNFKRLTRQVKTPKPAPPTIFDGDWAGVEYESRGITLHFIFHMHNTEDGLLVTLDCPDERFKGALASKVTYDTNSRQISITIAESVFTGNMTADGKALDTSMTEPGFHFLIHFDRLEPKKAESH